MNNPYTLGTGKTAQVTVRARGIVAHPMRAAVGDLCKRDCLRLHESCGALRRVSWERLDKGAQDALEANFDPNKSENLPTVSFWLKHNIQRVATANSIKVEISLDNYKSLMKGQNESTSFLNSGRHYNHYRAILDHDDVCL
eukprot:2887478-Ditylum_brightwellii.AAC.1